MTIKDLFEQAMVLSDDEREHLAERLIASLPCEEEANAKWEAEIARRLREEDDDSAIDWEDFRRELRAGLSA